MHMNLLISYATESLDEYMYLLFFGHPTQHKLTNGNTISRK
uniref:Uncharacterized protein n=1 Tax=Rhizophora mucronata TaxID=61149 RepID=A0A2P2NRX2_RHIMU